MAARICAGPGRELSTALAAGCSAWALARFAGADGLPVIGAPAAAFLPFTPVAAAGAWLAAFLLQDRRIALGALALSAATLPRAIPRSQPPAAGAELRILTANLLVGRAGASSVAELVRRTRADVFFLQELGSGTMARLASEGLEDELQHVVTDLAAPEPRGNAIYARYPLKAEPNPVPTSSIQPVALLGLPGGEVRLGCVHLHTPRRPWQQEGVSRWRADLASAAEFPVLGWPGDVPVILAGDFNATIDHIGFRRLLRLGLKDAAAETGKGLVPTWGPLPGRGALLTLDHVLVDARCAVAASSVHRLPGTDHRAVFARVRLPAAGP